MIWLSATLLATPAAAQLVRLAPESMVEVQLQTVLEAGIKLEHEQRWGDALTHYEDALRSHPGRMQLKQRLNLSKIHFDLSRRYADSSYVRSVTTMSQSQALEVYIEVLNKVYTHYVTMPNLQSLLTRGTENLQIAMSNPTFLQQHSPRIDQALAAGFIRELRRELDQRTLRTRQDASNAVAAAATLAWNRLRIPHAAVVMEYTCGAVAALDDYSAFLTPTQLDDIYSQIEGNFVGLGIELRAVDGNLLIVNVLSDSPANQSGIVAGDQITAVNGQPTAGATTDVAADMLKGQEGSTVELTVLSTGNISRNLRLRRQRVEVPSIENVHILDHQVGIGYMRLTSFQKTTTADLDKALWKLHHDGMRSLIVDVRGNPGGLLTSAIEVADKFVERGRIVSTRGRSVRETFDYRAHRIGTWRVPLVVLVDRDSASASEIFAAAIHDLRRGTIVGQTSYGKGSVQGIFPLARDSAGVRLTTAKFFAPNGQPISKLGVTPNIEVHVTRKPITGANGRLSVDADDPFVSAALQAARQLVAQR